MRRCIRPWRKQAAFRNTCWIWWESASGPAGWMKCWIPCPAYYERSQVISRSVKSAATYPLIMIAIMAVIIGILIGSVLPVFNQVFQQLGSEMSSFAQGIMRFGAGLSRYSAVIVGVLLGLTAAWLILRRTAGGRAFLSHCYGSFFATRRIAAESGGPGALPPLCR